jgi:hypothetical protein
MEYYYLDKLRMLQAYQRFIKVILDYVKGTVEGIYVNFECS